MVEALRPHLKLGVDGVRAIVQVVLAERRHQERVLGAQVDEPALGAHRERRDGHALDDQLGVVHQQLAILERAGLAFV